VLKAQAKADEADTAVVGAELLVVVFQLVLGNLFSPSCPRHGGDSELRATSAAGVELNSVKRDVDGRVRQQGSAPRNNTIHHD